MGQRSATESVISILLAFVDQPTWRQAALAERVGISVASLRTRLRELQDGGMPIERDEEPPQVFWSVPRGWFPGGVVVAGTDWQDLLRLVVRSPQSKARRRLLKVLAAASATGWVVGELNVEEEGFLASLEDCAGHHIAARVKYVSRRRGVAEWRHVSVHRLIPGTLVRLVVTCHRSGELRWFRLDHVKGVEPDAREGFRDVAAEVVESFVAESVGGFHGGVEPVVVSFVVRDPEARWVIENLPLEWEREMVQRGLRVTVRTSSLEQVARYVVGLGAAAVSESEELGEAVRGLALGALRGAVARGNVRAVRAKRSSGWGVGLG